MQTLRTSRFLHRRTKGIVNIIKTNGDEEKEVPTEKYKLIHTHTARRTGATLMYLSGMDVYDIIKITGHTSPVMLRKYIKADELEVVEKITEKYKYFYQAMEA